jgi:hypothetical protein
VPNAAAAADLQRVGIREDLPMLGPPKARRVDRPVVASLEALVPRDHFSRHLARVLDLGFVRDLVRGAYAGRGRPGLDPVVFFKLHRRIPAFGPTSPCPPGTAAPATGTGGYGASRFTYEPERPWPGCPAATSHRSRPCRRSPDCPAAYP